MPQGLIEHNFPIGVKSDDSDSSSVISSTDTESSVETKPEFPFELLKLDAFDDFSLVVDNEFTAINTVKQAMAANEIYLRERDKLVEKIATFLKEVEAAKKTVSNLQTSLQSLSKEDSVYSLASDQDVISSKQKLAKLQQWIKIKEKQLKYAGDLLKAADTHPYYGLVEEASAADEDETNPQITATTKWALEVKKRAPQILSENAAAQETAIDLPELDVRVITQAFARVYNVMCFEIDNLPSSIEERNALVERYLNEIKQLGIISDCLQGKSYSKAFQNGMFALGMLGLVGLVAVGVLAIPQVAGYVLPHFLEACALPVSATAAFLGINSPLAAFVFAAPAPVAVSAVAVGLSLWGATARGESAAAKGLAKNRFDLLLQADAHLDSDSDSDEGIRRLFESDSDSDDEDVAEHKDDSSTLQSA